MAARAASKWCRPGSTKEDVWLYPRPPALEPVSRRLRVMFNGQIVADTTRAYRILETTHPPTYYLPPEDIKMEYLSETARSTYCEWKGSCSYYTVRVGDKIAENRAWFYKRPSPAYAAIANYVSFYASPFDCFVDDEKVAKQEGDFYGGWVTSDLEGKMKGGPGTFGW
ncbi:hypothetical protein DFJ74DRAFT_649651 [Hyaloraphidium curvatum]|nr:hypothetical protein DFJ74DRAFT_649651 [Hyaloraphidium curvatum]